MSFETLWDWRRQVAAIYAAIRADPDPQAAWTRWRGERDRLYREHPQSPLDAPATHIALPFFPYDPALRFAVALEPAAGPDRDAPAGADGTVTLRPFARTSGLAPALGGELTLFWLLGYCGGVFLPFADSTTGRETYGGGRYLLDTIKSADLGTDSSGRTILDFNFAYNPSCAYAPRYTCPLTPPANRLASAVSAGERSVP